MKSPTISVLIPLYNGEKFIAQTIESVLNQTYTDFEIIIVDNCSIDRSVAIARNYESDKRVKIFQNHENIGAVRNWNQCMLYASGEYLKFLFADDYFKTNALEEFIKPFESDPSISLVIGPREYLLDNGSLIRSETFTGFKKGLEVINETVLATLDHLGEPSFVMFRKKNLNIGLFNTHMLWLADIDYNLRMCETGDVFGIKEYCVVYRRHQQQETADILGSGKFFKEERNFYYYNFFIRASGLKELYTAYYHSIWKNIHFHLYRTSYRQQREYLNIWPIRRSVQIRLYLFCHNIYRAIKRVKKKLIA